MHLLTPDKESVVDQRRIPPKTDLVTCGNMGEAFYTKAHPSMKTGNLVYATQSVGSLIVGKMSFPGC